MARIKLDQFSSVCSQVSRIVVCTDLLQNTGKVGEKPEKIFHGKARK